MAVAHHANYLVWFEIGRTDLCAATGITYPEIEARGFVLVVAEVGCRYRASFRYDDEILMRTTVAEAGSRTMRFNYELFDGSGQELRATGFTRHVWLDRKSWKPVRADDDVMKAFEPFMPAG